MKHFNAVALLILTLAYPLSATQTVQYSSIRQIGMGGAGIAVLNGQSALIQNPALLSDDNLKSHYSARIGGGVGTDVLSKLSTIKSFTSVSKSKQGEVLDSLVGLKIGGQQSAELGYLTPGFGIGLLSNTSAVGRFYNPVQPTLHLSVAGDIFPTVGCSTQFKIGNQSIAIGVSGEYILRESLYDPAAGTPYLEMGNADLIAAQNNGSLMGHFKHFYPSTGFGLNLGAVTTISTLGLPMRVGASMRNIGTTLTGKMKLDDGSQVEVKSTVPVTTTLGAAITPEIPIIGEVLLATDYTLSPSTSIFDSLHLGAEKTFGNLLALRAGVNQGYIGMGVGVTLGKFEFGYAFNTIENGVQIGAEGISSHIVDVSFTW